MRLEIVLAPPNPVARPDAAPGMMQTVQETAKKTRKF